MAQPYTVELDAAIRAVRRATQASRAVQQRLISPETIEKKDKSPVTVADFASQAVVAATLAELLPHDVLVAEEDARELRGNEQATVRKVVVEHVNLALGCAMTDDEVLDAIDRGGAAATGRRYWTLDPIDGTKGFLRQEQYAVALALIEEGKVVLGVLGCPNLVAPGVADMGALFAAVRGRGATVRPMSEGVGEVIDVRVSDVTDPAAARFCESVESGHSNQSDSARIAAALGITSEPLRMDSQCKYATVARGDASIYLRMPTRADYRECIWDHAAGLVVVEEAGGRVTDVTGIPLDFTHGRRLEANRGVVATNGHIHEAVLDAVRGVLQ
jgi:3'(2'), 5'-bisphosphate nucleotidase